MKSFFNIRILYVFLLSTTVLVQAPYDEDFSDVRSDHSDLSHAVSVAPSEAELSHMQYQDHQSVGKDSSGSLTVEAKSQDGVSVEPVDIAIEGKNLEPKHSGISSADRFAKRRAARQAAKSSSDEPKASQSVKTGERGVQDASLSEDDLLQDIDRNIRQRADHARRFRTKVFGDEAAEKYAAKMREKVDAYTDELASKFEESGAPLTSRQQLELKQVLSEGLTREKGQGWNKLFIDSRSFDLRSTDKRLKDVMTKPPLRDIERRLNLTAAQKEVFEKQAEALSRSPMYNLRSLYDATREYAFKGAVVIILVYLVSEILNELGE